VLPLNASASVTSSVNFPPKITHRISQVTWAYFVDSKEAHKKQGVTNSRDHNQPVIARTPHPSFQYRRDDPLVAQHEVLGQLFPTDHESRRDGPAAPAIGPSLRDSMHATPTPTQDCRPGLFSVVPTGRGSGRAVPGYGLPATDYPRRFRTTDYRLPTTSLLQSPS
jgi:hypothetical protein